MSAGIVGTGPATRTAPPCLAMTAPSSPPRWTCVAPAAAALLLLVALATDADSSPMMLL